MPPSDIPFPSDSAPQDATLVPLRLVRVVLRERSDQQWIFLQEDDPDKAGFQRGFPIVIGTGEASEIHRLVTGVEPPRPLTHQTLVSAVGALGSRILGVDIVDLQSNTFYAHLRLATPGTNGELGQEVKVDARPSDALAIALRSGAPIRVAESVLEQVRSDKAKDQLPDDGGDQDADDEFDSDLSIGDGDLETGDSDLDIGDADDPSDDFADPLGADDDD